MVGMGGSSGWAARRTPDCSATGTTSCRNLSSRRHNSSWEMDWQCARGRVGIVNHVPDHSVRESEHRRQGRPSRAVRAWPRPRGAVTRPHTPARLKLYPSDRNAGFTHAANNGFDFFNLLRALQAVEQNVVPVAGSRFSIAARTRPASSISRRSVLSSSTVHSFSGSPATPPGFIFPARWADCRAGSMRPG